MDWIYISLLFKVPYNLPLIHPFRASYHARCWPNNCVNQVRLSVLLQAHVGGGGYQTANLSISGLLWATAAAPISVMRVEIKQIDQ